MPEIFEVKCSQCDFTLQKGWGGVMYVKDDEGKKVICRHPVESYAIARTLKTSEHDAHAWLMGALNKIPEETKKLIEERTGFDSDCLCLDCLSQFRIDVKKEEKKCPQCSSLNVKTQEEMVSQSCPKCKEGIIQAIDTGRES